MRLGGIHFLRILLFAIFAAGQVGVGFAAPLVPICQIQGNGFTSPRIGQTIRTQGVVSADFDDTARKGFFVQMDNCDGNPATSDGIFVYLSERLDIVSVGDLVEVNGTVQEYYGFTEINATPQDVSILSQGNTLPTTVELNPPLDDQQARSYFESLEGMLVTLSQALVVGPTDSQGDTWLIRADLGLTRVFRDDPAGTGAIICVGDDGHFEINPPSKVGDQISDLQGVLDFSLGSYRLLLLTAPTHLPAFDSVLGLQNATGLGFSFGTFNLENLFDTVDEPIKDDPVLSGAEYHRKLEKLALTLHNALLEPDLLAVQEVENATVLMHLLARPEIEAAYGVVWQDGPDKRGIDVALLYRQDRVTLLDFEAHQGCTTLVDGFGPDGNRDVENPQNLVTCDTNGDGILDGNRLFSRPPLMVQLQVDLGDGQPISLWVLVNHWKSKREDTDYQTYTQPRRLEQAQFVAAQVADTFTTYPAANLIVVGDLNAYPDSQPLAVLTEAGLKNLLPTVARPERYTYIYQGISQVLDHVLLSPALFSHHVVAQPVHLNADYPYAYRGQSGIAYRGSDHDPVLVNWLFLPYRVYLPVVKH